MSRLGLRSRRVVRPEGIGPATVWMRGGRIEAVEAHGPDGFVPPSADPGATLTDVGDLVVAPGLVDCHVHLNEPGRTEWEGFASATRAAAAGGVTSLVDMPLNCLPVTTTREALETKLAAAAGQLFVDVGFWGGVVPGNAGELPGLAAAGALGCKAFLVHSGIDEFPNATEGDLRAALPVLARLGLPLLAHAELDLGAPLPGEDAAPGGAPDPRAYHRYLRSRPPAWEDAAIRLLVDLCRETGCPVHVVHLSSASSLDTLRAAKAAGLPLTVETCPHYLCFEAEAIPAGATHFKCAPPIREAENRERLWHALSEGVIDFVITDHSPCLPGLKLPERGDFLEAWGGIASLQLGLPAVWTEARRRGAGLRELTTWMSERPAAFAGLGHRKGRLAPGYDADLVVWNPDAAFTVREEGLHFRHKVSPYLGRRLEGEVVGTWLGGRCVYRDGRLLGEPGGRPLLHRGGA
jgi:allantoinase